MITLNHKVWDCFFCSGSCEHVRLHGVVHCVRACQWRRVVLQKGQRSVTPRRTDRAKAASPARLTVPPPSSLCCHGMSLWVMVSLATGCFLCSEGDAGGLLKVARGEGKREYKVILGGGKIYGSKVNNFQPLFRARLFWFPILLFNQHRTLIKTATQTKWTSICIYMLCKIRTDAKVWIHLDVVVFNVSNSHV